MSHQHHRKEKDCLNCGTQVVGDFCHVCGQENVEPKESFGHMFMHFFNDITHFDGKFFTSTWLLIKKPGFLPKQYMMGKRAYYLNPIRMYVFASALFFFFFFSFFKINEARDENKENAAETKKEKAELLAGAHSKADSVGIENSFNVIKGEPIFIDTTKRLNLPFGRGKDTFTTRETYLAHQQTLPLKDRDGFLKRHVIYREMELHNKYGGTTKGSKSLVHDFLEKFIHSLPYLLFISLPLYALFLKLLYGRNKQFYYADHGIFLIYLYIFTFVFGLVYMLLTKTSDLPHLSWLKFIIICMFIGGVYYAYKSMRVFYGQGRGITLVKYMLLNVLAFFSLIVLFILLTIFSVFVI